MGFSRQEYWSGVPLPSPKVQEFVLYLMAPQSVLSRTAKWPAGLGACGSGHLCPNDGSFFS